ncbi:MAG: LCP family protein [Propionibacteriaceae bacterium]
MASHDDLDWLHGETPTPPVPQHIAPAPAPAPVRQQSAVISAPVAPLPPTAPTTPLPPQAKRRHPLRRALTIVTIVILAQICYLATVPLIAWHRLGSIENATDGQRPAGQVGTTILLVGSDSRDGLSEEEAQRLGLDTTSVGSRTDTMMLLYIPPEGRSALISLPRDSYVNIPGYGPNKLNAAYALGGPTLLTQTVEQATELHIDGYAAVGFSGFATVVDAVGGVMLCPTTTIEAEWDYPQIEPGCQRMDARTSLWYVRSRHSDPMQDLGRVNRQREFLNAILSEVASPATVLNPVRYWRVNMALAKGLGIGKSTSQGDCIKILTGMQSVRDDGLSFVVPIANPNLSTAVGSVVEWDNEQAMILFAQLSRGDTSDLDRFKK